MVDYHGSRLVRFQRLHLWPTAAQIVSSLEATIAAHGAPARLLTDRAPIFRAAEVEALLEKHGTRHVLILPNHAWTNGRIERFFRTFKETVFRHLGVWLLTSVRQADRFCRDFATFYTAIVPTAPTPAAPPPRSSSGSRSSAGRTAACPTSTAASRGTASADGARRARRPHPALAL